MESVAQEIFKKSNPKVMPDVLSLHMPKLCVMKLLATPLSARKGEYIAFFVFSSFSLCILVIAAGSSIIYKLTCYLVLNAVNTLGLTCVKRCLVVPMATGMSLVMCLLSLRSRRPDPEVKENERKTFYQL